MTISELTEASALINTTSMAAYRPRSSRKFTNGLIAICERHPLVDSHRTARRISKAAGAAISIFAKVPFAPISLKLGKILGPISIAGSSTAFFILEYWAISGTVNDLLGPKTQAEFECFQSGKKRKSEICRNVVIISVASIAALASQLPTALAGVDYNSNQYKIVAGLVLLIAGALIPVRSLQLSIEQIRQGIRRTAESEITKIKGRMISLFQEAHSEFIRINYQRKMAFVEECREIRNLEGTSIERTNAYILKFIQKNCSPLSLSKKIAGCIFNYTGFAAGTALAGIFEYALGDYTYALTKEQIWDNEAAGGVFAALAVGSTAYLFGTSIIKTTQRIFNLIGNAATGGEIRNLGWQLRPKLSFALTAIGLLIDVSALGPTYIIWGDFYNQNEIEHELFQKSMIASLFLVLFTSTLDIIDEVVVSSIARGTEEEREILQINNEFQELAMLVKRSPASEFIRYLIDLDEDTKAELFERMNLSANQLAEYCESIDLGPLSSPQAEGV